MGGREEIRFWFSALNLPSTSRRTISAERLSKIFKLQVKSSCTQGTLWCCGSWIRVNWISVSMVADGNILHVLSNWGDLGDLGFLEKFYCVKARWWECHLSQGLLGPKKVPPPTHQPTQRPRSSSSIRGSLLARITFGQFSLRAVVRRNHFSLDSTQHSVLWRELDKLKNKLPPSNFASQTETGKKIQGRNTARRRGEYVGSHEVAQKTADFVLARSY